MNELFKEPAQNPAPPIDPLTAATWVDPLGQQKAGEANSEQDDLFKFFQAWHLDVMLKSEPSLKERITWFFHSHLPARWTEIRSSEAIYYQNCLYRHYAYGSFKELFTKICTDNAMLVYLDGYSNHKDSPNENFAREMFELYSIGKGSQLEEGNYTNYTEDDIKAATRVLTGWIFDEDFSNLDADTGLPIGKMSTTTGGNPVKDLASGHDKDVKTFSSLWNNEVIQPAEIINDLATVESAYGELDDLMDMIFDNPETARFIVRKMYRHFVYHFISEEVESDIIVPLAQTFQGNDYSIPDMLKVLMKSEHFYDEDTLATSDNNIGALIKSPIEVFTTLMRFFDVTVPDRNTQATAFYDDFAYLISKLEDQGLNYYEPFEVAGYPAYHQIPGYGRNWIMTHALAHRYQTGDMLMKKAGTGNETSIQMDVLDWAENSGEVDPTSSTDIVTVLTKYLLAVELTTERFNYFLNTVFLDTLTQSTWLSEWNKYTGGGDDLVVRERLETLVSSIIQTPEFQLI
ncbi:MAG: hypothetical protein AMS26_23315 [Bacteroides sp. SM23_62]|nr:MAG: hypothetical protein AMS26_23315 [Bacteroides sp. SM23_62]